MMKTMKQAAKTTASKATSQGKTGYPNFATPKAKTRGVATPVGMKKIQGHQAKMAETKIIRLNEPGKKR